MSFSSTSPWATGKACRNGPFPRRSFEIGAIVVAFIYWWPLAFGYVAWKLAGYPAFAELRDRLSRLTSAAGIGGRSRFAAAFVEELKRAKDREQFDAFMAKRRSETGSNGARDV